MEDYVVHFVVTVNDPTTEFFLVWQIVAVPGEELVKVLDVADWYVGFDIDGFSLGGGDSGKGFDLTGEVVCWGTVAGEADACRVDG
jgi:hypothetical protein